MRHSLLYLNKVCLNKAYSGKVLDLSLTQPDPFKLAESNLATHSVEPDALLWKLYRKSYTGKAIQELSQELPAPGCDNKRAFLRLTLH